MTVDTKKVAQRREVRYGSFDDLLADAERLATGEVHTVGNWTLGQMFQHLAQTVNASIDGTEMRLPWLLKKLLPVFLNKQKMLNDKLSPGFKIPKTQRA